MSLLLITHSPKYYNITKGVRVVGIMDSRNCGKLASRCYVKKTDNRQQTTDNGRGGSRLVVS